MGFERSYRQNPRGKGEGYITRRIDINSSSKVLSDEINQFSPYINVWLKEAALLGFHFHLPSKNATDMNGIEWFQAPCYITVWVSIFFFF